MRKRQTAFAMAALLAIPTLLPAQSNRFNENFTLPVAQIDANSFEVIEADGAGNSQIWCAASIYARKGLGLRQGNLTITTPRGPAQSMPGRKGVVFSTVPIKGARPSVWPGLRRSGLSYRISHAYAFCSDLTNIAVRTGPNTLLRR
ncbi:MAG: hypothetical protein ABJP79_17340 [Tateyamaria sp.]|uniref:hypothetical protein n=1 Tax=Tateyamaria sp. TaxID=1929288 RepID=UPI00329D9A65